MAEWPCEAFAKRSSTHEDQLGLEKTRQTARNQFLELPLQKNQSTSAGGRDGLYQPSRIPLRRFGAVEPPLRPQHTQTSKTCEQATQYDTSIERSTIHLAATQQRESDDGAQTPFSQPQDIHYSH